ncbi:CotH kinase family protein [Gordonibacter massiliensis (ex Traore et al. 2017)]|uniref:CotH kinase family protein n=1 Tax=Gordonibacter massiliensis (ex Traore et al. 2017) TaxID=1841863 RepID=UPI001C8CE35D|nr:CotH kinase family protein [Gordonibacter massiliensis (ex Traore et al. 2017)]MBX9033641.1 hypothetical protein [Gordonibacter massiliensis (ex Traore et al. 2017)]
MNCDNVNCHERVEAIPRRMSLSLAAAIASLCFAALTLIPTEARAEVAVTDQSEVVVAVEEGSSAIENAPEGTADSSGQLASGEQDESSDILETVEPNAGLDDGPSGEEGPASSNDNEVDHPNGDEVTDASDMENPDASKEPLFGDEASLGDDESKGSVSDEPSPVPNPSIGHWEVRDVGDGAGLQRYWIDADGNIAIGRFISPDEGAGYWAYAMSDGRVLRGKLDGGAGYVYLADNDGRLASGSGWVVTDVYDIELQRYYLDEIAHGALSGYFTVDGDNYFGLGGQGYVLRGVGRGVRDDWLVADNDGKLAASRWVVTDAFGQGLQRYWFDSKGSMAKDRLVDPAEGAGYWAYAKSDGMVLRGKMDAGAGFVYLADNDGRLASLDGWLVTGLYDGGVLQRYFISEAVHAALSSYFTVDGDNYFGLGGQGYVLRGVGRGVRDDWLVADNDGKLAAGRWVVTDAFGQGLQRYWFDSKGSMAKDRLVDPSEGAGYWAYARSDGYVVRGKYTCVNGAVYLANNDGGLEKPGWLVSASYDNGIWQRYWIDDVTRACKSGLFTVGVEGYYGMPEVGYVLRGSLTVGADTYRADNDGMLVLSFKTIADAHGGGADIVSTFVGDTPYLFLPAHASLSSVPLMFAPFAGGNSLLLSLDGAYAFEMYESGSPLDLIGLGVHDSIRTLFFKSAEGSKVRTLAIMISADLGAMYLVSSDPVNQGRFYVDGSPDHTAKATGSMLFVKPDGSVVYNGELTQIKGRGNTTWRVGDKKPYQIKLDKKTDLMETGEKSNKAKTWVLLANANDVTLLRNMVALELAQALGLKETPECRFVDLYYDGEYRGNYLLCEKVEINGGRVDITKLEDDIEDANPGVDLGELPLARGQNKYGNPFQYVQGVKEPADITGGYLLELDGAYYSSERCWFGTSAGYFVVKGPENLSLIQMLYISELMQEAINSCNASGTNAQTGLAVEDYIDVDSFAKMYLLNEFSKNIDWSASSTYFYLPSIVDLAKGYKHVFYAGPAWDFDSAFGIRNDAPTAQDPEGLWYSVGSSIWYLTSYDIEYSAKQILSSTLLPLVQGGLLGESGALQSIDSLVDMLAASQAMNHMLWEYASFGNCLDPYPTYEQNIVYLKNWIAARVHWFATSGWAA